MPFFASKVLDTGIVVKAIDSLLSEAKKLSKGSGWNRPSSSGGCLRQAYFSRTLNINSVIAPRTQRIFDNGDCVHERLQKYLKKQGMLLIDEAIVFDEDFKIHGRTDGIIKIGNSIGVLEIKSMNSGQFKNLTYADNNHIDQAMVYAYCINNLLKLLSIDRSLLEKGYLIFLESYLDKENVEDKHKGFLDYLDVLEKYSHTSIKKVVILYENKDNQELKEFIINYEESCVEDILTRFSLLNKYVENEKVPEKSVESCRYCNYKKECKKYD